MASSTVYIKNHGIPFRGAMVSLAFKEGGMSGTLITDSNGRATFSHIDHGDAEVVINGQASTVISTPTTASVEM